MKKTIKLIVIIALALALATTACDGNGGGNGNGNGNGKGGGAGGKLTVTGLPSGSWDVKVFAAGTDLSTAHAYMTAVNNSYTETMKMKYPFEAYDDGLSGNVFGPLLNSDHQPWTKSGSFEVILLGGVYYYATVNFTNGNATVPFSSFKAVTYL